MDKNELHNKLIEQLKTVYDPEIPVSIWDLGLIYSVNIDDNGVVDVLMTLTAPNCPASEQLPLDIEIALRACKEVSEVKIDITFEPPWDKAMMSEEARLELGFMDFDDWEY